MFKINNGQRLLVENGKNDRGKIGGRGGLKMRSEIFCATWEVS